MIQTGHCVNLLEQKLFKKWIFNHFFFGNALDGVECGRRCGFGGQ